MIMTVVIGALYDNIWQQLPSRCSRSSGSCWAAEAEGNRITSQGTLCHYLLEPVYNSTFRIVQAHCLLVKT